MKTRKTVLNPPSIYLSRSKTFRCKNLTNIYVEAHFKPFTVAKFEVHILHRYRLAGA